MNNHTDAVDKFSLLGVSSFGVGIWKVSFSVGFMKDNQTSIYFLVITLTKLRAIKALEYKHQRMILMVLGLKNFLGHKKHGNQGSTCFNKRQSSS